MGGSETICASTISPRTTPLTTNSAKSSVSSIPPETSSEKVKLATGRTTSRPSSASASTNGWRKIWLAPICTLLHNLNNRLKKEKEKKRETIRLPYTISNDRLTRL